MNRTNTFGVTNNVVLTHFGCDYEIINERTLKLVELHQAGNWL
jgi:hypothetical protein